MVPGRPSRCLFPGVTIVRDRFDVPHVSATTHDGGVWAAGWITAEDRGLLLQQARYDSLVAAIDAPGLSAIGLVEHLKNFVPSQQTVNVVSRQTEVLLKAGSEGRAVLHDIDIYLTGINAYLAATHSTAAPFTRTDIYAFNALKDQFFGEGGGDEANRSMFLGALERRLGIKKGYSVFNDLRQNLNAGSPTTVDGTSTTSTLRPSPARRAASCLTRAASRRRPPPPAVTAGVPGLEPRPHASNELMVEGRVLRYRASAAGRRTAGRILLPRSHAGDRHARSRPELAGSHLRPLPGLPADRPRSGLRHHADLSGRR